MTPLAQNHHTRPYGVGLAYRYIIHPEVMMNRDRIDLLELPTEDYLVRERRTKSDPNGTKLRECLDHFPCTAHGLALSLGSVEPLDNEYLEKTREFLDNSTLSVFSEHCAFHRMDGNDLTMFLAMPFCEDSVQWIASNYRRVREKIGRAFALENVTYHFAVPHCPLEEADFLRRITEETDCTLLLDVTNVFNNTHNHKTDVAEFLDRMPLDRVTQLHLAGGHLQPDGKWEDSHSSPVMAPVWELYEEIVQRTTTRGDAVVLERDSRFNPFDEVLADLEKAREIFYAHRPINAPALRSPLELPDRNVIDFDESSVAELRGFQRNMMARVTSNPEPAALSREWQRRLDHCPPDQIYRLAESWDTIQQEDASVQQQYEQREWAAWAEELGMTG